MRNSIHIGKLIKEKFKESGLSKAEFMRRINRERSTAYGIFERDSVDIKQLFEISKALHYDFIKHIYEAELKKDDKDSNENI